jgi:signal transduction histidine kinase
LTATEVQEITTNIIELTGKALQSTRRIAHDLLPPVLDKFGLDGIEELCSEFNSSKAVLVTYKTLLILMKWKRYDFAPIPDLAS